MSDAMVSEGAHSPQIKSCFFFTVSDNALGEQAFKPFRDPVGPYLLGSVVHSLRELGFRVSDPKPGKACDAGFTVAFERFGISVTLIAKRHPSLIRCGVLTWIPKPLWRRAVQPVGNEWERVCAGIEQTLKEHPGITSLERLARTEFERGVDARLG